MRKPAKPHITKIPAPRPPKVKKDKIESDKPVKITQSGSGVPIPEYMLRFAQELRQHLISAGYKPCIYNTSEQVKTQHLPSVRQPGFEIMPAHKDIVISYITGDFRDSQFDQMLTRYNAALQPYCNISTYDLHIEAPFLTNIPYDAVGYEPYLTATRKLLSPQQALQAQGLTTLSNIATQTTAPKNQQANPTAIPTLSIPKRQPAEPPKPPTNITAATN